MLCMYQTLLVISSLLPTLSCQPTLAADSEMDSQEGRSAFPKATTFQAERSGLSSPGIG